MKTHDELIAQALSDPAVKAEYDALADEFAQIRAKYSATPHTTGVHMIDELTDRLANPGATPEQAIETAIMVYIAANAEMDKLKAIQQQAKDLVGEIMVETGKTKWHTDAGQVYITAPGTSVRYDAKMLDALAEVDRYIDRLITPYRRETERPGTLVIRGMTFREPEEE